MLKFRALRYKNFLSTGNHFTEYKFDQHARVLVAGKNGSGKSTLEEALCFACFGKPFRNINKPQLVNSINQKDCLVELELETGGRNVLIRRGIKPTIFEVYIDGRPKEQDARSLDFQAWLEESILHMNYKTFSQIIVLASTNYVPFMQLKAAERRTVIESILDIEIYSQMNAVLKRKVNALKQQFADVEYAIRLNADKQQIQQNIIEDSKVDADAKVAEYQAEMEALYAENEKIKEQLSDLNKTIADLGIQLSSREKVEGHLTRLEGYVSRFEENVEKFQEKIAFYQENPICPTCKQGISETTQRENIRTYEEKIATQNAAKEKATNELNKLRKSMQEIRKWTEKLNNANRDLVKQSHDLDSNEKMIEHYEKQIADAKKPKITGASKKELRKLQKEAKDLLATRSELLKRQRYYDVAQSMLKDTGVKTKIIQQYLPVINKTLNKYLAEMNFFTAIHFDENFNETITSRHHETLSYHSFSEGEKFRIDLALLFTWRQLAKLKNSINANLLIFDEVFDSSLDSVGTDDFVRIISNLADSTNIIVISHKQESIDDKFDAVIRFEKKNHFSVMAGEV